MKKIIAILMVMMMVFMMMSAVAESAQETMIEEVANEVPVPDEADCQLEHDTIEVNGTSLYYGVGGEGKPIVIVHGNGGDHSLLQTEANALIAAGYKVYAVDSRGQGANAPVDEYHYTDMAEDYYAFIEAMGIEGCAYYGWSDGGIIGLIIATTHPEAVSVMAISGANLNPEGADPAIIEFIAEILTQFDDPCTAMMLVEPQIDPADLAKVEIPVLVTAGSEDVILPEHTQLIADSLANSTLTIVDGHGHETYIQGSDIMGEMLIDFLKANNY